MKKIFIFCAVLVLGFSTAAKATFMAAGTDGSGGSYGAAGSYGSGGYTGSGGVTGSAGSTGSSGVGGSGGSAGSGGSSGSTGSGGSTGYPPGISITPPGIPSIKAGQDACEFGLNVELIKNYTQDSMREGAHIVRVFPPSKADSDTAPREIKLKEYNIDVIPKGVERTDITRNYTLIDNTQNNFWIMSNQGLMQRFQRADVRIRDKDRNYSFGSFEVLILRGMANNLVDPEVTVGGDIGKLFTNSDSNIKKEIEILFVIDLPGKMRPVSYVKFKDNYYDMNYTRCLLTNLKNITNDDLKNHPLP